MLEVREDICKKVLELDSSIRFAGVINDQGKIISYEYNRDVMPLITSHDLTLSAMQAFIRMGTRATFEHKTGKALYSCTVYEKVKRATIPLNDYFTLLVSFELQADHESIIMKKITPLISGAA